MIHLCIDRFEAGCAICEEPSGTMRELPRELLPRDAQEGDVLILFDDGTVRVDQEETRLRRERILALQEDLFE